MHYSPVCHSTRHPKITFAFDLHVLGTPPALTLSQDQTLQFDILLIFFLLKVLSLCEFNCIAWRLTHSIQISKILIPDTVGKLC